MRIVLISPKGPLYRHRGGIFKKSLRYMPLTLTTLAALVPEELGADLRLLDEGIDEVDPERIERLVSGITRQLESAGEAEVAFVCGSNGFVEAASALLAGAGYDRSRIRLERYGASCSQGR